MAKVHLWLDVGADWLAQLCSERHTSCFSIRCADDTSYPAFALKFDP